MAWMARLDDILNWCGVSASMMSLTSNVACFVPNFSEIPSLTRAGLNLVCARLRLQSVFILSRTWTLVCAIAPFGLLLLILESCSAWL